MSPTHEYTVEIARSVCDVLALRDQWQELPRDPNGDIDFYLTFIESNNDKASPHVIVLRQGGTIKSILAGRIEDRPLEVPLGYRKLSTRPLRFLTLIHGGLLGEDCEKHASLMIESVWESLKRSDAEVACFHGVDSNTALYRLARTAGWLVTRDFCPVWLPRWRLKLAANYEDVYRQRSANTRHNLKRYSKRLLKAYGDQLEIRRFGSIGDLEKMMSDTEVIAKKTYLRGLGAGFAVNDQTRRLLELAANQGWLRAQILYLKGEPCAFWNGLLYRRTFFTLTTGYQPDLADFRPGMFLLQKLLEDLCAEGDVDEVDFGFGDAQYKRDLADYEHSQAVVLLFAPNLKGIVLNCLRTPLIYASNQAHRLLAKTGIQQKVKKAWRTHLNARASTEEGHDQANS
jgi:hypothetical protein